MILILTLSLSKALIALLSQVLTGEMFGGFESNLAVLATNIAGRFVSRIPCAIGGYPFLTMGSLIAIWGLLLIFSVVWVPLLVGRERHDGTQNNNVKTES